MSKTVATCICETNLIANQPQENVFFLTLSRKKEDFPNEFLRTARSTSPIQVCAVFSCIGPDNASAMLNIELNKDLEMIVGNASRSPVLDFEAFSNQVINVLNVKVCNVAASTGTPLKVSMSMIVIEGDILRVIHVGNTKATLFRDNRLMLLTEEQTVAHKDVQMGVITPEQELSHPDNMNLTQYLGKMPQDGPVVPFKKVQLKLKDNDEIFLMGLGISHLMPSQMRNLILVRPISPENKARDLINSAMNYGIKSGLTAICMKVESTFLLPGDAVIGSHLASDGTVAAATAGAAAAAADSYTPFGDPAAESPRGRNDKYESSDTRPFNPKNEPDYYDNEDDGYDDGDEYDDDYDYGYVAPSRKADKRERNRKIAAFVIPIVIFLICVIVGFGVMFLIFNIKDLMKGTPETTATTVSNLVYYVTEDGTPVFSQEDVNSALVASLNRGDPVTVVAQGQLFSSITLSNGLSGYIQNDKINIMDPTAGESSSIFETDPTTVSTEDTLPDASEDTTASSSSIQTTEMVPQGTEATRRNTPTPKPTPTSAPAETTPQPVETTPTPADPTETPQPQPDPQPEEE